MSKENLLELTELGNPILRQKAKPVANIFDDSVQQLIDKMLVTVTHEKGVGLAAPQVGELLRLFIVSPEGIQRYPHCHVDETLVVINPEIKLITNKTDTDWEGCLSIPGVRGKVTRVTGIEVSYTNRLGEPKVEQYFDFVARIFLHENDHLDGIVFLDRMKDPSKIITDKEYIKLFNDDE